eukprot:1384761-Rhodomonas_salina.3
MLPSAFQQQNLMMMQPIPLKQQQTMMASNSFSNPLQLPYLPNLSLNATNLQSVLLSNAGAVGMPPSASLMEQSPFAPPSSLQMQQPPLSLRTQMFTPPTKSSFHPGVQHIGGITKMNQRPSRQATPKELHSNISNPIKLSLEIKFADKADPLPNGDKQAFSVKVEVANGYPIMLNLQEPKYQFEPFCFNGTKCVWYTLVKTEKLYHAAADYVQ